MTIDIRPATLEDTDALVAMAVGFITSTPVYHAAVKVDIAQLEALVAYLLEHGAIFVADERERGVVGMIGATVITHPMSGERIGSEVCWWMQTVARGSSAALRLLKAAERWAYAQGAVAFQMIAPASSPQVGRLYERRGYTALETVYTRPLEFSDVSEVAA